MGGFGDRGRGGRGRGRGRGRGGGRGGRGKEEKDWVPVTKLGRLVKDGKIKATYAAVAATYAYLTPDLWKDTIFQKSPYQEFTDWLQKNHKTVGVQRQEVKQY